jgi:GTP-binding protein HflX
VGVHLTGQPRAGTQEHLFELELLADTAGGQVAGRVVQERARFDAATLVGKGKADEIGRMAKQNGVATIIFDDELSPAQIRNLEKITGLKVIDRAALILDIFARRARSREARTQVELAQLQYLLPRLTRQWQHLSRQAGGTIGLKGVGETQLELDRRLIRRRIAHLKVELDRIESGRRERRRGRSGVFKAALIGYTNAGKSTLFNALSLPRAAHVEDRLFATLDPLVRRFGAGRSDALLIDTVGFIRKLPHDLVASFRSTLEESADADLLIHVVDVSSPHWEEQMAVTGEVLNDLGLSERPTFLVLNKADRAEPGVLARAKALFPGAMVTAASLGRGVDLVAREIASAVSRDAKAKRSAAARKQAAGA